MKKILRNIVCATLATWVLSIAVGHNVVKYCCSGCEASTVEFCQDKAEHNNCCGGFAHEDACCADEQQNSDNHCTLVYFKADFPVTENAQNLNFEPKEFDLTTILPQNLSSTTSFQAKNNLCPYKNFIRGRDILSKISILII